jgi:hypothetical protein
MMKTRRVLVFLAGVTAAACGDPSRGDPAYRQGELGNGGFLFQCDDSVACDRWSTNNAKDFPKRIATGSVFNLRFVPTEDQGLDLDGTDTAGITLQAVEPYVGRGTEGFAALKPGYGTVIARRANGAVVDYVTLTIVQPTALVVYPAEYKGTSPERIERITMKANETKAYRVVAESNGEAVAGSVRMAWSSGTSDVVSVTYQSGVARLSARAAGKTTLTAEGAALSRAIDVEVTP